jgi:hypothetical protein
VKRIGALGPLVSELRGIVGALSDVADPAPAGPVLVTGMLAEQLARQLGEGAAPGGVVAADASRVAGSSVLVHVIAGDPGEADDELVRRAETEGVPVILVQLWPQAEWTKPYVLTPFVVECQAGQGFPVGQIAARIVEAVENAPELARKAPVLAEKVEEAVIGTSMIRAAILATLGKSSRSARPLITLEQIRMLAELQQLRKGVPAAGPETLKAFAAVTAAALGTGFLLRGGANVAKRALPAVVVDAAVAAGGTWALGETVRRLADRAA